MIQVEHLTKNYGDFSAVSDLSFTINNGKVYGLLGPNGAGKSTTMNMMTGCLSATEGDICFDGISIFEEPNEVKKKIGYLPEIPPLYPDETPEEYLTFVAQAKGIEKSKIKDEVSRVIKQTNIEDVNHKLIKHLSKGYKQRVGIAQALLNNPEVIILDEPTVGLDPLQIIEIRELISQLKNEHTVIVSSHILSEIQTICDEVLIIAKGKLVGEGTIDELEKKMNSQQIKIVCQCSEQKAKDILSTVKMIKEITTETKDDHECCLMCQLEECDVDGLCSEIFFAFAKEKIILSQINKENASLEKLFVELTESEV